MARFSKSLKFTIFLATFSGILMAAGKSHLISFSHPAGHSAVEKFNRGLTCYVSDALAGHHDATCTQVLGGQLNAADISELGQEQLTKVINPQTQLVDAEQMRAWWGTWSYAMREKQLMNQIIASDLETFKKNTLFTTWTSEVIAPSLVKKKTRIIYRSPESFVRAISVAQTLDADSEDMNARVLETEVAIDRNDGSGNADFYSYNARGHLSTTSQFPVGERQVPAFCLGCHFQASSETFTRFN